MREESRELKVELNQTKTELVNCENKLQQALEPISPPVVVVCEPENPTPEPESENTESPAVNPQPSTVNPEPSRGTTKPKLLTPGQLAKWINETHHPEKTIKDYNIRDWFKKGSACTDKYRAEVQEKYGFKFSHCDKKGTLWFTVG